MATLTQITQLNPGSLYAAFKSKQGPFLAALDHYGQRSVEQIRQTLVRADTPLGGVRAFFRQLAASAAERRGMRSCFLLNTVLEVARHDPQVRARVKHHLDAVDSLFRQRLESAQERGELAADADPKALSAFIMTNIWGLRILLAAGAEPQRCAWWSSRCCGSWGDCRRRRMHPSRRRPGGFRYRCHKASSRP